MTFLLLLAIVKTILSYLSCTYGTFFREFTLQIQNFSTPYYCLGIVYEDMGCEDQLVKCFTIGFILFNLKITTYAHTAETIQQYPWLREEQLLPWWQKIVHRFLHSLDIPIPGKNKNV